MPPAPRFQVEREVRHHVVMAHPNVVALHAAFEDAGHVYLVQEYAGAAGAVRGRGYMQRM